MGTQNRKLYFDLLNICACICVVALHCNQMVHTYAPGLNWAAGLVIEVLFYWAVPIFFMLSGATLMRYRNRYDTKTFLIKRFKRTVIPFLFWSIFLYLYVIILKQGEEFGPRRMINAILNNQVEQVYWFFFPLFSIYLAMPVLSLLADHKKVLWYMVASSFVLTSVLPFLLSPLGIQWPGSISLPACGGMLMFVILGFLLSETEVQKKYRYFAYALGAFSLCFRYVFTYINSTNIGIVDRTYFNYLAWPSVLLAIAVFLWFKQLDTSYFSTWSRQIAKLSGCSFGVYLIHKPILDNFVIDLLNVPMNSILLRTIGIPLLYITCILIVRLMKRLPALRSLVP